MESGSSDSAEGKPVVVACPLCKDGVESDCALCGGQGKILHQACVCGRPSLYVEHGVAFCGRRECWETAMKVVPVKPVDEKESTGFCGTFRGGRWVNTSGWLPNDDRAGWI